MQSEAGVLRCPSCGAPCSPDARACPHCDVELASVRCTHCFALHFVGSRFCARCGRELAPEPLLDVLDAPCPRCARPLRVAGGGAVDSSVDGRVYECTGCGGLFVDRPSLDRIIARANDEARRTGHDTHDAPPSSVTHPAEPVHYVKCPACRGVMNRMNFGRRSGVIVDVCKQHGTWFDAGELTSAVEYVASGGYEDAKRREAAEKAVEKARAAVIPSGVDGASASSASAWWGVSGSAQGGEAYKRVLDMLSKLLR